MIAIIKRLNHLLAKIELAILIFIVMVMVGLAGLQIFLRKVLNLGLLWADIFLRNLVLWVSFIGASLATLENKHININLLTPLVPQKWRKIPVVLINLLAFLITILLTRASVTFVGDEKEFGSTIFSNVPAWYFQLIIPIGFGLMAVRFFINMLLTIFERQEPKP